jgi:hypothetical protein
MIHDMAYGGSQGTSLFSNVCSDPYELLRCDLKIPTVNILLSILTTTTQL